MLRCRRSERKRSANRKELLKKINELDVQALADQHVAGRLLVRDILLALLSDLNGIPGTRLTSRSSGRGIIKVDDLKSEMQLDAQVVNVVDFGVFVDIGLGESSPRSCQSTIESLYKRSSSILFSRRRLEGLGQ